MRVKYSNTNSDFSRFLTANPDSIMFQNPDQIVSFCGEKLKFLRKRMRKHIKIQPVSRLFSNAEFTTDFSLNSDRIGKILMLYTLYE